MDRPMGEVVARLIKVPRPVVDMAGLMGVKAVILIKVARSVRLRSEVCENYFLLIYMHFGTILT